MAIQQYNANQAIVLGTRLEQQPAVLQAATEVRNAWLALQRTQIVSPISGYRFPSLGTAWRADRHHHAADGGGPGDQPVDRC